jgi:hypothetical protein
MKTIVLGEKDIVAGSNNTTLVYKFPNSVDLTGCQIAVSSINMYYSWDNISITFENNTFSYNWIVAGVPTTFTVVIPNGLYEIKDINNLLQFTFIQNGHYLVNGSGLNVYYAEFIINPTRYAVQINTFPVPTALPPLFTNPAGLVFPAVTFNPIITLPAKFNDIVGFTVGFTTPQNLGVGTNLSFLSSKAPQVQPNSNVFVNVSGIDNKYATPSSVIYSVSPSVALGELIVDRPANFNWNRLLAGTYNQLRLQFTGNTYETLNIRDPNMSIILVIQDQDDNIVDIGAGSSSNIYGQQHSRMARSGVVQGNGFR